VIVNLAHPGLRRILLNRLNGELTEAREQFGMKNYDATIASCIVAIWIAEIFEQRDRAESAAVNNAVEALQAALKDA